MDQTVNNPDLIIGRPSHQPTPETRERVTHLSRLGLRQCDIAASLRISEPTLRKRYKTELAEGAGQACQNVMATLYQMATNGKNTAATIFFARTRCGVSENTDSRPAARRNDYSKLAKYVDTATTEE